MGKIKQGILGGFSGKVANVVGSSWKGIAVMKSLPLSVANPKTAAQLLQRARFSILVKIAANILTSTVKPLWDRFAQKMSGFNAFVSKNFDAFSVDSSSLDLTLFSISEGKMLKAAAFDINWATATSITATWTDDASDPYALATDIPHIVIIDSLSLDAIAVPMGEVVRSNYTITKDIGLSIDSSHSCMAFIAFARADGTIVSDTQYCGMAPFS